MFNVRILFFAQMLTGSGLTAVVLFGGILSSELSPNPAWATLPVSLAVVGMALSTIPASAIMRMIGRRAGFIAGASVGIIASLLCAYAIAHRSFVLFCAGSLLFGTATAFTVQYRFAAAESVSREHASQAISYVLLGGLGAALIGPQAAMAARTWLGPYEYVGSFVVVAMLYAIGAAALSCLRPVDASQTESTGHAPAVGELLREPMLLRAMLAGASAYCVMSFIMTAAPVSMHAIHHHGVDSITWTIQSHILAMFLPSLFSGRLIARFGDRAMMMAGCVLLAACAMMSFVGHEVPHYWVGLVLLGAGWNFLFTAGTSLLATHYTGAERHRAQAINDFVVFTCQACVSLLAGFAVTSLGWQWTNLCVVPVLALMMWVASRDAARPVRALAS